MYRMDYPTERELNQLIHELEAKMREGNGNYTDARQLEDYRHQLRTILAAKGPLVS